jgi:hypothetical protein
MRISYLIRKLTFQLIASLFLIGGLLPALKAQLTIDMPDAVETQVTGINDDWTIVGFYTDTDGITRGFCIIDGDTIFYLHNSNNTWFGGINNNNKIVGRYNPSGDIADYHAFTLDLTDSSTVEISALDGYEYMSPNDINDLGAISGDLKNGANRRFFIYDQNGLNTQNYLIDGTPMPTYGGYGLDNLGRISGWYLDGGDYISFRYHPDLGFMNIIDLNDPEFPTSHKTRLMGMNNNGKGVLDFIVSDNAYIYDFGNTNAWIDNQKFIPASAEIHLQDINSANSVCGYYMDANYVVHGYADIAMLSNFNVLQNGHAFINQTDPVWPPNILPVDFYAYDHYWYEEDYQLFPDIYPGHIFPSASYPSWTDYVSMLSPSSCYYNVPNYGDQFTEEPVMRPNAFAAWKVQRSNVFHGACFGMASNAGASWQFPEVISAKFQAWDNTEFNGWDNLYIRGNDAIDFANMSQAGQASQQYVAINAATSTIAADSIINIIAAALMGGGEVPVIAATLMGNALIAGHALFPYGIGTMSNPNEYAIMVYDPNAPGDENVYIKVKYDGQYGSWTFLFGNVETNPLVYGLRLMHTRNLYDEHLLPSMPEINSNGGITAEVTPTIFQVPTEQLQ